MDTDRVELEQDLDELVVQSPILSSKPFARCTTLLGFICVGGFVHGLMDPCPSIGIADTQARMIMHSRLSVGEEHALTQ